LKLEANVKLYVYALFFVLNGLNERNINEVFTVLKLKNVGLGVSAVY